jgi:phage internal scaffolding protein
MKKIEKRDNGTIRVHTLNDEPSMTDQTGLADADINVVWRRMMRGGQVPLNHKKGVFGDFTNMPSYQDACQTIVNANNEFMKLPSDIRLKFENDPQRLMDYLNDPDKKEESYKLGLRLKDKEKPADPVVAGLEKLQKSVDENTNEIKSRKKQ